MEMLILPKREHRFLDATTEQGAESQYYHCNIAARASELQYCHENVAIKAFSATARNPAGARVNKNDFGIRWLNLTIAGDHFTMRILIIDVY